MMIYFTLDLLKNRNPVCSSSDSAGYIQYVVTVFLQLFSKAGPVLTMKKVKNFKGLCTPQLISALMDTEKIVGFMR